MPSSELFKDITVLSPHFIPDKLPFREDRIGEIVQLLSPALKNKKPNNLFIYGKTGTGKTSSIKRVMEKFGSGASAAIMDYMNCRVYNSRYRIMQKILKPFIPELEKSGFGLPFLYEKLIEILQGGKQLIVVLDEIDMIKDLDDLIYTLTRINDEVKTGGLTIIGISNRLSFKDSLDPRSRSSLSEADMVFPPYTSEQLQGILSARIEQGFNSSTVEHSAINLIAALTAQESGDARYALKLLFNAGEIASKSGKGKIDDDAVQAARKKVEIDLAAETIHTLPENHQLTLYAIALLSNKGSTYTRLHDDEDHFLFSGEVYDEYVKACRQFRKRPRSLRWYKEYLNELEMLGLISTSRSSKGIRGQTTLIRLGGQPNDILEILKKSLSPEY